MAHSFAGQVGPVRVTGDVAIAADLALPNPRRLMIFSIVAIVVLGLSVVAAAAYAVVSIDLAAIAAETGRAKAALSVVLGDGGQPDALAAKRLAHDFSLIGARFGAEPDAQLGEVSLTVAGIEPALIWTPRRLGTELGQQLAPLRLLASALFLIGIAIVLNRLYRLALQLEARRLAAQQLASRDALTGLHNRLGFDQRLAQTADVAALLYLDLDGFKQINDSYGHGAGDDLLRVVAARLAMLVGAGDFVARIGGDEFAFLRLYPTSREQLAELADDIAVALSEPVRLGTTQIQIGVSIGIAMSTEHGEGGVGLLGAADSALYRAKVLPGRAFVFADVPCVANAA